MELISLKLIWAIVIRTPEIVTGGLNVSIILHNKSAAALDAEYGDEVWIGVSS